MGQSKFMLGTSKGCAMRLAPIAEHIGLSEGIEDALSVTQLYGLPCWATGSTSGLTNVQLPPEITQVTIYSDGDAAGVDAARKAAQRLIAEGRKVEIFAPPDGIKDFNELLKKKETATQKSDAESAIT